MNKEDYKYKILNLLKLDNYSDMGEKYVEILDELELEDREEEFAKELDIVCNKLTELLKKENEHLMQDSKEDEWIEVIFDWADKFSIPTDTLPRDRDGLMGLTELEIVSQGLITPLNDVSELVEVFEEKKEAFYLPVELFELTDLTKLEVLGMRLTYLPDEIEKLEKLTELKLTMNQLEMIPSSVGNLKNLTTLDLSINWLEEIPITLAKLKNLKYLNIDSNQLTITSSQEDWLYELADDGCEVIWDKENTTVIGEDDEYDEEQSTRDLIEMMGGEEALVNALKN